MEYAISYGTYYQYLRPRRNPFIPNIEAIVQIFNDGELAVEFPDSIRGKHIFIFGDTVKHMTELVMTIDAARRSAACRITVVFPYYGFCRQDKKGKGRASLGAAVVAKIVQSLGVDQVIAIDLHADQIQLAYQIPFEHLSGAHLFENKLAEIITAAKENGKKVIFCSPDAGGTDRVKKIAKMFGLDYIVMAKDRAVPGEVAGMRVLADPAELKDALIILIDDIVDTAGTLILADKTLRQYDPFDVMSLITHPVLSESKKSYDRVINSGIKLITSDTRNTVIDKENENIVVVSCYDILHQAILNITENRSILTTLA